MACEPKSSGMKREERMISDLIRCRPEIFDPLASRFAGASLPDVVTPGSFTSADITIDEKGRVIAASNGSGGGGGAPTDAAYIIKTPDGDLPNAQALSALSTGLMQVTTTTGTISSITTSAGVAALISDKTGTGALVFGTSPTLTTPTISGVIAFPDDVRQTFNPGASNAGLNVGSLAGDPSSPSDGDIWYDSSSNELTARINGANVSLGAGGGAPSTATYITQTPDGGLANEQALSLLSTGLMRVTTATGVISSVTDSAGLAALISDETGSGSLVFATSPTLVTPNIGVATATSINGLTITSSTGTLTVTNGKVASFSNTLTFTGTDSSSVAFGSGGTVAYTANDLSVFASTTSLQLAGVISDETGSGALVFGTSPTIATPTITGAIVFQDGVRQTFNPDGTNSGLNVGSHTANPSSLSNGDIWYNSTSNALNARINGTTVALGVGITGSGTTNTLAKFTGATAVGDSTITDDGALVTFNIATLFDENLTVTTFSAILGSTTIEEPPTSDPGTGRFYFNSDDDRMRLSNNQGAYNDIMSITPGAQAVDRIPYALFVDEYTSSANFTYDGEYFIVAQGYISAPGDSGGSQRFGFDAEAVGANSTALGHNSYGGGDSSVALGQSATATNNHDIIVGSGATGSHDYVVVFGTNAQSTEASQILFGSDTCPYSTMVLGNGVVNAVPVSNFTIVPTSGSGTDVIGTELRIRGGASTGSAAGGDIVFSTTNSDSSGSYANSYADVVRVTYDGAFQFHGISTAPAVSPSDTCRLYYDTDDDTLYISKDGAAYEELGGGAGVAPWTAVSGGAFTATPASSSTITMTSDLTSTIKVGMPIRYVQSAVTYYAIVTAIASNLLTIAGAPLNTGDTVTTLEYGVPERVINIQFMVAGLFADTNDNNLLQNDMKMFFRWQNAVANLVKINARVSIQDTGINQSRVNMSINGNPVSTSNTNAGLNISTSWVSTVVDINVSNYDVQFNEDIEIRVDNNGSNKDAQDLSILGVFVLQ